MKTYRVGFLGFGFIGRVHAYGYVNLPLFYDPPPLAARITHICTGRPETAEKGRVQMGADVATTDFREITENPEIDIVHICSPNDCHREQLLSAMSHNKHIYCDKPLVSTMAEAEDIRAALAHYSGTAQMTLQNRFFPATMRAKQLVDEGFLGEVLEYRACYLHSGSASPDAPLKWKLSGERGGGVIADLASHVLDLVHHLLGDYDSILATTRTAYSERPSVDNPADRVSVDAEDCVMMLARMKSGGLGHIEATKIATGTEDELRFELHGSKGAIRFNTMAPHFLEVFDGEAASTPLGGTQGWTRIATGQRYPGAAAVPSPKNSIGWIRSHAACLTAFLEAVAEGRPGDPGLEQGIYVQRLIECTRQSAAAGEWNSV